MDNEYLKSEAAGIIELIKTALTTTDLGIRAPGRMQQMILALEYIPRRIDIECEGESVRDSLHDYGWWVMHLTTELTMKLPPEVYSRVSRLITYICEGIVEYLKEDSE